jgi:hypothetical protein
MANVGVTFDFAAESAKLRSEIDKVRLQLSKIEGESKKTTSAISSGFKQVGDVARQVGAVLGVSLGIGAIATAFKSAASEAIKFGDEMQKAAAKTGIGASQFALLAGAARMSDVEVGQLSSGLRKMQIAVSEAGTGAKGPLEAFRALGVTFEELQQLKPEDQFLRLADQISGLESPADRVRAAVDLFGKSGAELLPLFEQGAEGIRKAREEVERLGGALTDQQIEKLAEADDAIKRLDQSWKGFARTLVAAVAPALTSVLDRLSGNTAGQVSADLGLAIAKLKELERRQDVYSRPGYDQEVLADINRQIKETTERIARLRTELYQLQGESKGAQFRKNFPELDKPQGYLPEDKNRPLELRRGTGIAAVLGDRARGSLSLEDSLQGAGRQIERDLDVMSDPKLLREIEINSALQAIQDEHNQTMLGKIELFEQTRLGSLLSYNDLMINAEMAKNMTLGEMAFDLVRMAAQSSGALGKVGKAFAVAQTIWSTGTAIMRAYEQLGPIKGTVAAAAIAAKGAMHLANIKKTNIGTGGSLAGVGGGGITAAAPALGDNVSGVQQQDQRAISQVVINGNVFSSQETAEWIIGQIRDAVESRDVVFISSNSRQAMELAGA